MPDQLPTGVVECADVWCPHELQSKPQHFDIQPGRYYPDSFGNVWTFRRYLDGCDYSQQMECVERGVDALEFNGMIWENNYQVGALIAYRKDGAFGLRRPLPHNLKGPIPFVHSPKPDTEQ